ncbi:O-antigen polysaccharide polymerase Wzy [Exiguobacterium sp. ZWU0009]|uniref:O-antigen polysaccharide polymerase Wzy n=1 Tax=Exiguobacterium sp. ZWU0009 TaxID=1224749 RepID=UPI00064796F6|nr:O-antigen polysaccharide polymerase Wzy [Exiguobacterium sp. ZWU0009]
MFDILSALLFTFVVISGLILSYKLEKDWSSPIFLVLIWVLIFIVGDVWYSVYSKNYGPGESVRFFLSENQLGTASNIWMMATIMMLLGYYINNNIWDQIFLSKKINKVDQNFNDFSRMLSASKVTLSISFVITLVTLIYISLSTLKLGYTLTEVSQLRNNIFSNGNGYLLISVQMFKYAILFWLFYYIKFNKDNNDKKSINIVNVILIIFVSLMIDLFLGTRSSFVYGFLLPLLILINTHYRKIKLKKLLFLGIFIFIFIGIIYRTIARDQYFLANKGGDLKSLLIENLMSAPDFFWGGFEASSFDGAIDIIQKINFSNYYLYGKTFIDGLTSPIPRSIFENKVRGGGNYLYTTNFYPDFYGEIRSEYSISFLGELYYNGGLIFVGIGFLILGIFLSVLKKVNLLYSNSVFIIFYGVIISRVYSLLRGDFYNFISQLFISIICLTTILLIMRFFKKFKFE